jgi:hypothetical protein
LRVRGISVDSRPAARPVARVTKGPRCGRVVTLSVVGRHPGYPFVPRTVAYIRPGDFWAIPLRRGGWYACGRVLDTQTGLSNRLVTVGLLDWCEPDKPTPDAIAGVKVLDYGIEHVRFIAAHGGIRGHRPLELDGGAAHLLDGRPLRGSDVSVWADSISGYAHARFGRHFPETPVKATERPSGIAAGG